jgi:hypothetical protein
MSTSTATVNNDFRVRGGWAQSTSIGCLAAGLSMMAAGAGGILSGDESAILEFKFAYLTAFIFTVSVGLGALFFVLIQHATGARWSIVLRRIGEQLMMTIPLSAVLFIPILLFLIPDLYAWSHPEHAAAGPVGAYYLNIPLFTLRSILYFIVWIFLAMKLKSLSLLQDATGDRRIKRKMAAISSVGLVLYALTITFAAFDWLMSLGPHWYSTIYGVYYFAGAAVAGLAALILLAAAVVRSGDVGEAITTEHFHDLGKLMFGFVVFWAYIAFSQLLLIWMANLPEETRWFHDRWSIPGWKAVSYVLLFGHFVLPFLFLLPRTIKRLRPTLIFGAIWMLAAHFVDMFYLVMPAFSPDRVPLSFREPLLAFGMLLVVFSYFFYLLRHDALVPVRDPALTRSMAFENF